MLTVEQKQERVDDSEQCLAMFQCNKPEVLLRYVITDETWIHYFTPESKRSSSRWTATGESHPKHPKAQQLTGKIMASVFWDVHCVIFIDYLENGNTINSEYYRALLEYFKVEIAKKRLHMAKKNYFIKTPCHKLIKTVAKLHELNIELLPHPPYLSCVTKVQSS